MPVSGEVAYSVNTDLDDVLQEGRPNVVSLAVRASGSVVSPDSGTFTLYPNNDTDAVITAQSVTIGADGISRYTIPAAVLDHTLDGRDYGTGWMEVWDITISGTAYQWSRPAAMALRPISPSVSDETLLAEHPDLLAIAPSGTTTFQTYRDSAWGDIVRRWLREGGAVWPIANPSIFHEAHRELSLGKLFANIGKSDGNQAFMDTASAHRRQYESAFTAIVAQYDRDQDGRLDDPDKVEARNGVIHRSAATTWQPRYRYRGRRMLIR